MLVEHFIRHQEQNGDSLIGFLRNHYSNNHKDADQPEDERLPFKSIPFYNIEYAVVTGMNQANAPVRLPADKKINCQDIFIPKQDLSSIFHPPESRLDTFQVKKQFQIS